MRLWDLTQNPHPSGPTAGRTSPDAEPSSTVAEGASFRGLGHRHHPSAAAGGTAPSIKFARAFAEGAGFGCIALREDGHA